MDADSGRKRTVLGPHSPASSKNGGYKFLVIQVVECIQQHSPASSTDGGGIILQEAVELSSGFSVADMYPSVKLLYVISGIRYRLKKVHENMIMGTKLLDLTVIITLAPTASFPHLAAEDRAATYEVDSYLTKTKDVFSSIVEKDYVLGKALAVGTSDKVQKVDQNYQVSQKVKSAVAKSAELSSEYASIGASWVTVTFDSIAKAAAEVSQHAKKVALAEEEQKRKTTDVMGMVEDLEPIQESQTNHGPVEIIKFTIYDGSVRHKVHISGPFNPDALSLYDDQFANPKIVIMASTRISEFRGTIKITNLSSTKIYVNLECPEVTTFRQW
uniref:Uncharacterized protein n=1 Tax=Daucus carota subsp. sativus TaxID=79200 RepID=A0A175YF27_DAUCS